MGALATAVEKINALPVRTWELPLDDAAQIMVDQPWRIGRAMGDQPWHHVHETYPAKLIRCRDQIAKMEGLRADGHHTFSLDTLVALKQAERALEVLTSAAVLTGKAA